MRVSVQYGNVSHVRLERIDLGDGPWHKLYITDCDGNTDEVCLFGPHNWPHKDGRAYEDISWQGFDAALGDKGTPDDPVHSVPFGAFDSVED